MIHKYSNTDKFNAYAFTDYSLGEGLRVVDIGHHCPGKGHSFGPAVRENYLIHAVVAGKGKFTSGGVSYNLGKDDCFIIRPMEVTTYGVNDAEPWEYYWVSFNGSDAKKTMSYAAPNGECVVRDVKSAANALVSLYKAVGANEGIDELEINSRLLAFLGAIHNDALSDSKTQFDPVESAVKFIESNYYRNVNITDLAAELGVTRSYFTGVFTAKMGKSPYEYLTDYRIEKATLLLKSSDLRVSEVAYSVGFSGIERFSDMFKKRVGESPAAYRKNITEK